MLAKQVAPWEQLYEAAFLQVSTTSHCFCCNMRMNMLIQTWRGKVASAALCQSTMFHSLPASPSEQQIGQRQKNTE